MKKTLFFALGLTAGLIACRATPHPVIYADPGGGFRSEIPDDWRRDGDKDLSRRPVAVVSFIGKISSQDEGIPIGAVISVTRITRVAADVPGGAKGFAAFQNNWLCRSDALFGGPKELVPENQKSLLALPIVDETIGGLKAKAYSQDYAQGNPIHNTSAPAMRLEDAVIQTPEAYYVLEYRATLELFDKYFPVYRRFKAAAAFGKAP